MRPLQSAITYPQFTIRNIKSQFFDHRSLHSAPILDLFPPFDLLFRTVNLESSIVNLKSFVLFTSSLRLRRISARLPITLLAEPGLGPVFLLTLP